MSVFAEKLLGLTRTMLLSPQAARSVLADRLRAGAGRRTIAVGSGGSLVSAAFISRCRATLGLGPTTVATPMELVLGDLDARGADVWLSSAGAANPDVEAAYRHCIEQGAERLTLLTTKADGHVAISVAGRPEGQVVVLPVSDPKDGFLATHSLVATTTALLLAANELSEQPDATGVLEALLTGSSLALAAGSDARQVLNGFHPGDTLLLLHDPQAAAVAILLETSLWETGIAPVQRVDFRNFAHGRHVWLARHPERTFVLALTARESREVWNWISTAVPLDVRRGALDLGNAGRLRTAIGVAAGLALIDELGRLTEIDPGRPGRGDFAPAIYEHRGLVDLVDELTPDVMHKRAANLHADPAGDLGVCLYAAGRARRDRLGAAKFQALALDYDGTVVTTGDRFSPPRDEIIAELVRLLEGGMRLGIATGRGGSAGDAIRAALPGHLHAQVLMGYYNGAHLLPLSTRVEESPPAEDEDVASVAAWLAASRLNAGYRTKVGPAQITIECGGSEAARFSAELAGHPAFKAGRLKIVRSQHSVDVVATSTTKLRVVAALSGQTGDALADVLAIGDSGAPLGNDHELLSSPMSISVDRVCGDVEGCWTLFGDGVAGPDALHRILRAIEVDSGLGHLNLRSLGPVRKVV